MIFSLTTRDPQALLLLNRAFAGLQNVPEPVTDVTLTANATYTAGSDHETGTATLDALGAERSRVTLNLDGGQREEVRNSAAGSWSGNDGVAHAAALHNCWTDASWFTPLLILEAALSDPTLSVALADSSSDHSRASG